MAKSWRSSVLAPRAKKGRAHRSGRGSEGAHSLRCAGEASPLDASEVYFLILHFLSHGPCAGAASLLAKEAVEKRLLPTRVDVFGNEHVMQPEDITRRYANIPPGELLNLVAKSFKHLLAEDGLDASFCALLATLHGVRGSLSAPTAVPEAPWASSSSLAASTSANLIHPLRWRESGDCMGVASRANKPRCGGQWRKSMLPTKALAAKFSFTRVFHGHRNAIYCLLYDKAGRLIITGSDDKLVKVWSARTGLLLASCRGHSGDITDLAVNSTNEMVASASNDLTVRVWNIQDSNNLSTTGRPQCPGGGESASMHASSSSNGDGDPTFAEEEDCDGPRLGHQVTVLVGHRGPVTSVKFSPTVRNLVMSTSDDGEVFFWDATVGTLVRKCNCDQGSVDLAGFRNTLSQASGSHGGRSQRSSPANLKEIISSSMSSDGKYVAVACADGVGRVFSLPPSVTSMAPKVMQDRERRKNALANDALGVCCEIHGHTSALHYIQFSHAVRPSKSTHYGLVTASKDGSVRTWTRGGTGSRKWSQTRKFECPLSEEEQQKAQGTKRKPKAPIPEVCIYSRDDSMVLASATDNNIYVWGVADGTLKHILRAHERIVYVLDCHPFDPALVLTAGYDGKVVLWDLFKGESLFQCTPFKIFFGPSVIRERTLGTPFELVDGFFSSDGQQFVISDMCGQFYIFGCSSVDKFARAPYQQFFAGEFRQLIMDSEYNVLDATTNQTPISSPGQDIICNCLGKPYAEPLQAAFGLRNLESAVSLKEAKTQIASDESKFLSWWYHCLADPAFGQAATTVAPPPPLPLAPPVAAAAGPANGNLGTAPGNGGNMGRVVRPRNQALDEADVEAINDALASPAMSESYRLGSSDEEDDDDDLDLVDEEDEDEVWSASHRPVRKARLRKNKNRFGEDMYEHDVGEGNALPHGVNSERHIMRETRRTRSREAAGASTSAGTSSKGKKRLKINLKGKGKAKLEVEPGVEQRDLACYSWLLQEHHSIKSGSYVPQLGDTVYYFPQGHEDYLKKTKQPVTDNLGPTSSPCSRCTVLGVNYFIDAESYHQYTKVSLTLSLADRRQSVDNDATGIAGPFTVNVPHPLECFPDFVVDAEYYERGIERRLRAGHKCKVYWVNGGSHDPGAGSWWEGEIAGEEDCSPDKWPHSPWNKYQVRYTSTGETYRHSPWEIHKVGETVDGFTSRSKTTIDPGVLVAATREVAAAMRDEQLEVFVEPPAPDAWYVSDATGDKAYYNALVPLPLSLTTISNRLQSVYYRQVESLDHDLDLIVSNSVLFNGTQSAITSLAEKWRKNLRKSLRE